MPQIFVNVLQTTKTLNFDQVPTLNEIYSSVLEKFPALETCRFLLFHQSKIISSAFCFRDGNLMPITLTVSIPTLGGKGGFGSQLKALGNRIAQKKVTNYESSRDLSGRRLRTVNDATKLADYIADAPRRKREEEEKLQKEIKKAQEMKETKIVIVDHSEFLEKLEKVENDVESAVKKGNLFYLL
jgi:Silencing defective 2 N-terminal ubiquitin domain